MKEKVNLFSKRRKMGLDLEIFGDLAYPKKTIKARAPNTSSVLKAKIEILFRAKVKINN